MKCLRCWIKAIPLWIRTGYFVPHLYEATYENAIIIAKPNGFRVADNYEHSKDETVYPKAVLERCKCVFCGNETLSWYANKEEMERMER